MLFLIFLIIVILFCIEYIKIKNNGIIFGVIAGGGLCNKIAGIPGTYLLSLISNRQFHSIYIYNCF